MKWPSKCQGFSGESKNLLIILETVEKGDKVKECLEELYPHIEFLIWLDKKSRSVPYEPSSIKEGQAAIYCKVLPEGYSSFDEFRIGVKIFCLSRI